MQHSVCPWWIGYLLLNPMRRLWEDPSKMLAPWVGDGMVVLEPGPGMGFFTLPLARMVGPAGRVVAVDLQERMLSRLRRRAARRGLLDRIDIRRATSDSLGVEDLAGEIDVCMAIHAAHEIPDSDGFFHQVAQALRPGGRIVLIEPPGHVPPEELDEMLVAAEHAGLQLAEKPLQGSPRSALLAKPAGP